MMALTPVNLRSVAVIAAGCVDIAIGEGATLIEIARDKPDLVVHALVTDTAHDKTRLLAQCYPSQSGRGWSDDDAILGLMRVRGVQCRARYAEAFTVEKSVLDSGSDYSVN
jgi:hypothetical protein